MDKPRRVTWHRTSITSSLIALSCIALSASGGPPIAAEKALQATRCREP